LGVQDFVVIALMAQTLCVIETGQNRDRQQRRNQTT